MSEREQIIKEILTLKTKKVLTVSEKLKIQLLQQKLDGLKDENKK
jgi:hypothetical protein